MQRLNGSGAPQLKQPVEERLGIQEAKKVKHALNFLESNAAK